MKQAYPDINYLRILSYEVGAIMREYFYLKNTIEWKDEHGQQHETSQTPLTIADKIINQFVLNRLQLLG